MRVASVPSRGWGFDRARAAAFALALTSAPLAAQTAGSGLFDDETGLWFPPGASKEAFLDGTAPRAYPLVLGNHLAADETLRREVCEWMSSPRNEVSRRQVGPRVLQMRTMAHMVCNALPVAKAERERASRAEAAWRQWLELEAARRLDPTERARRAEELTSRLEDVPPGDERLKLALGAIALVPQNEAYLLSAYEACIFRESPRGRAFEKFLRTLFTEESRAETGEGRRWRLGLRNLHFFAAEFAEARLLTADAIARPFLSQHDFDRVYLAVLDRALGDRTTWDALLLDCSVPEVFRRAAPTDSPASHYCWTVARRIVWEGIRMLGPKTPAPLAELLVEGIAAEPTAWGDRMESIRMLRRVDRRIAAREAEALLQIPFTISPRAAQVDALDALARIALEEKEPRRAIAALDRYLDQTGFRLPVLPPDLWERLRAVGHHRWEYRPPATGDLDYVRWALGEKVTVALESGDFPAARQGVAVRLAMELELHSAARAEMETFLAELAKESPGAVPEAKAELEARLKESMEDAAAGVRYQLVQVGRALQLAGERPAALRIAGFLFNQPNVADPDIVTNLTSFRNELTTDGPVELRKETSPWDPPAPPSPARSRR